MGSEKGSASPSSPSTPNQVIAEALEVLKSMKLSSAPSAASGDPSIRMLCGPGVFQHGRRVALVDTAATHLARTLFPWECGEDLRQEKESRQPGKHGVKQPQPYIAKFREATPRTARGPDRPGRFTSVATSHSATRKNTKPCRPLHLANHSDKAPEPTKLWQLDACGGALFHKCQEARFLESPTILL